MRLKCIYTFLSAFLTRFPIVVDYKERFTKDVTSVSCRAALRDGSSAFTAQKASWANSFCYCCVLYGHDVRLVIQLCMDDNR